MGWSLLGWWVSLCVLRWNVGARHTDGWGGQGGAGKVPVSPWGPMLLWVGGSCRVPGGPPNAHTVPYQVVPLPDPQPAPHGPSWLQTWLWGSCLPSGACPRHPWGVCPPVGDALGTRRSQRRGVSGAGLGGGCCRPQGLPRESRAAQEGVRRQGHHRTSSPSTGHGAAGLPSPEYGGGAGQVGIQIGPPQRVPLAKVRMAPVGVMMRWPWSGEPPALSPQVPAVRGASAEGTRPVQPAPRPCGAAPAIPAAARAPAQPWPPLPPPRAGGGPCRPSPAASGRLWRPPACPVCGSLLLGHGAGRLGAGRLLPGRGRAAFYAPVPCKSGLGWALPGRTSCVCCPLITGSVSEQTGG